MTVSNLAGVFAVSLGNVCRFGGTSVKNETITKSERTTRFDLEVTRTLWFTFKDKNSYLLLVMIGLVWLLSDLPELGKF